MPHSFRSANKSLSVTDGPCIVHRDFRPGNLMALNNQIQGVIDGHQVEEGLLKKILSY